MEKAASLVLNEAVFQKRTEPEEAINKIYANLFVKCDFPQCIRAVDAFILSCNAKMD